MLKWVKREYSLAQILSLVCQNVSKEVLLTGPKIQVKIPSHSGDCVLEEGQLNAIPQMATGLDPGFHVWFIMTLYYKMRQILLQNATAVLLQNVTEVYYKMR